MSGGMWWCSVECDARLIPRKLARRKASGYAVSGYGWGVHDGQEFDILTLCTMLLAPTRAAALSQLIADCPGGVVRFCNPADDLPSDRFEGLLPWKARAPLADPEALMNAAAQMERIEACGEVHRAWMARNERLGRTDDEAVKLRPEWPRVQPAYPLAPQEPR